MLNWKLLGVFEVVVNVSVFCSSSNLLSLIINDLSFCHVVEMIMVSLTNNRVHILCIDNVRVKY